MTDFRSSLLTGSEEDFDKICQPCSTEGQLLEAFKYCVDCREYLCKNCVRYHKKTKILKQHMLIDNENIEQPPKNNSDTCIEECSIHRDGIVKFFCPKHGALGCTDCMTMEHRTCQIDYIPDKCGDICNSEELKETMKLLGKKIEEVDAFMNKAETKDKEVDIGHEEVMEEIIKVRNTIDNRLDSLQSRSETNATNLKTSAKRKIKGVSDMCSAYYSDLNQLQSCLKSGQSNQINGQVFCALKRVQFKLQKNIMEKAEAILERTCVHYTFEGNASIDSFLSNQELGNFTRQRNKTVEDLKEINTVDYGRSPTAEKETKVWQYGEKGDINVTRKTDVRKCTITGCDIMSSGEIVLADYNNYRLKVIDIERAVIVDDKELDSRPWDVAVLPMDQIAVTLPFDSLVVITSTSKNLAADDSFRVKGHCYGIVFHNNCLYIVCQNPKVVLATDVKGDIKSVIPLKDHKLFYNPTYIAVSQETQLMYVSDCDSNSLVAVTFMGEVYAIYKDKDFRGPLDMVILNDGALLVCCKSNNTVHHITGDLRQSRQVIRIKNLPQSVSFNPGRNEAYIGRWRDDVMTILGTQ